MARWFSDQINQKFIGVQLPQSRSKQAIYFASLNYLTFRLKCVGISIIIIRILWVLVLLSQSFQSWGRFFSSKDTQSGERPSENHGISGDVVAEFSMEPLNNEKGMQLVQKAMRKAASSDSCWQNAYQNLFTGCSKILANEEKRSRLAWHLTDCFQKDIGRPPFPYCDVKSSMVNCLKELKVDARSVYLEFYLETNSICHQLQTDAFKRQTERLVNELKTSAENAEHKLDNIQDQAEHILQNADQIPGEWC